MPLIKLVDKDKVLKTALYLVKKTKKTLHLTMMMEEELNKPSKIYIETLKNKMNDDILIKRIGFGSSPYYKKALKQLDEKISEKFLFKYHSNLKLAQRLLISDKKEMIFAIYVKDNDKLVFYTKDKHLINGFLLFFDEVFKKSKN